MTPEQFVAWKEEPETREVMKWLEKQRDSLNDRLIDNVIGGDTCDNIALNTTKLAGMLLGINTLIELEFDDLKGDLL